VRKFGIGGLEIPKIMGHVENRVLRRGELATAPGSKKLIFKSQSHAIPDRP